MTTGLTICIEHFTGEVTLEQAVHHEVFHLIDHAMLGVEAYDDRAWHALNPPKFAFVDPAPETAVRLRQRVCDLERARGPRERLRVHDGRAPGALRARSGRSDRGREGPHDRARLGYLMGKLPDEHCANKPPPVVKSPLQLHTPSSLLRQMR